MDIQGSSLRNISLILFVIVINCQTSTTRASDGDDDSHKIDNIPKEYIEPVGQSVRSALFSTVATMRVNMSKSKRSINEKEVITGTLCASDGQFYSNLQEIVDAKLILENDAFCLTGCGMPDPDPCPSPTPVCTSSDGTHQVFANECHLNRTLCQRWGRTELPAIERVDPRHCRIEKVITGTLCASDGQFYSNLQEIVDAALILEHDAYCLTGCGRPEPDPCPTVTPVCTSSNGSFSVFENECHLNRTLCQGWGRTELPAIERVDPRHCQLQSSARRLESCPKTTPVCTLSNGSLRVFENECSFNQILRQPADGTDQPEIERVRLRRCELESCGLPQTDPCPRRVPVCAGYEGDYRIYEDECHLNRTRCSRKGNDLKPIMEVKIGSCQVEVNATQLTCYEILRGMCPLNTTSTQVCDLNKNKTFKNICRALHKRCKKQDDTCYQVEMSCLSVHAKNLYKDKDYPPLQDCSKYIRHSFPLVNPTRPRQCYKPPSGRPMKTCKCKGAPFQTPDIPEFPQEWTLLIPQIVEQS